MDNLTTVDAQSGQHISMVGDNYRLVITGEQTGGAYAIIDMLVPPGGGPGPHAHPDFQESYLVLEGEVEFKTEHDTYTARKGSFINIPLGGWCIALKISRIAWPAVVYGGARRAGCVLPGSRRTGGR